MDGLQRTLEQFRELFRAMSASQRLTLLVVPLLIIGGLGVMIHVNSNPAEEYLLGTFSADELKHAEEALRQDGLTQYHIDGQRIRAPKSEIVRYNAALLEHRSLPQRFGAEMDRMFERQNIFTPDSQRVQMLELAKSKELSKIIRAIPDIEDASVIWDARKRPSLSQPAKVTATVSVKLRRGRDLTPDLAQSLRLAVSSTIADLAPENVTVLNVSTGRADRVADKNDPFGSQFLDHVQKFTHLHQRNIADALVWIPNVTVAVNVDLDSLKESYQRETTYGTETVSLKTRKQTDTSRANERRPNSEPGVRPNTPRDVRQPALAETTRSDDRSVISNDNLPATATVSEKTFAGLLPKTVQVSVAIPREYFRQVALKQGESDADKAAFQEKVKKIEIETKDEVKRTVARLIPAGSPPEAVNVTSYVSLDADVVATAPPLTETVQNLTAQWGGPVALSILALWALWMLNRSMKKLPSQPDTVAVDRPAGGDAPSADEPDDPSEPTKRDQLQDLVRENPEMAAAVISRWITPPK